MILRARQFINGVKIFKNLQSTVQETKEIVEDVVGRIRCSWMKRRELTSVM